MRFLPAALLALLACCARPQPTFDSINADSFLSEIKTLSSDDFEGRKPASAGEQKTIAWLQSQFQQMGLKPGKMTTSRGLRPSAATSCLRSA